MRPLKPITGSPDSQAVACRDPDDADAQALRAAILLDELEFPGAGPSISSPPCSVGLCRTWAVFSQPLAARSPRRTRQTLCFLEFKRFTEVPAAACPWQGTSDNLCTADEADNGTPPHTELIRSRCVPTPSLMPLTCQCHWARLWAAGPQDRGHRGGAQDPERPAPGAPELLLAHRAGTYQPAQRAQVSPG